MKIIYQDLVKLLSVKPSKELLSDKLFQLGHEHELNEDIYDMELTPNRGDCLSLLGLARDLNVFFGRSDTIDIYEENIGNLNIDFENLAPVDCPKISFLEIEVEESSAEYKPYLENYFNTIGGNKTNLFTDISNYISYELGQPTHCFERDSIKAKLTFENKECNSTFKTLLNSEITLQDSNCVFSIDGEIISLAGVMGGASTACSTKTKKVLVECAFFNPESIIGKSVKYNLNSDAAHKFERGVDILCQEYTLRRFAKVVQDHAKIKSIKLKTFNQSNFHNISLNLDCKVINKILGTNIHEDKLQSYLKSLGFEMTLPNMIKVPSWRHDIGTNNDLAEEIARVVGYDNIASKSKNFNEIFNSETDSKINKLEKFLVDNGFSEVINFPFSSIKKKNSIIIDNPLDSNKRNFRISLKESLIQNLIYNERRQKDSIKLFEISDIYTKNQIIIQQKKLGLIISGRLGNNYNDFSKKLDRKYLDQLLGNLSTKDIFNVTEIPRSSIDTKRNDCIFYVEILIEDISEEFFSKHARENKAINFVNYNPVSEYPSSARDFSFSITNLSKVNDVIEIIENISDKIIKELFMFDFYKNNKTDSVKLGYRFIFQSPNKTLSDEEVNKKIEEILEPIIKLDGVSIPGMKPAS